MKNSLLVFLVCTLLLLKSASASSDQDIERLYRASCDKNIPLVESILKEGVDPNGFYGNNFPLACAAVSTSPRKSIQLIDLLIDAGADPNLQSVHGNTALMAVANHYYIWNPEVAQELISKGAKLDLKNRDGDTALILVAGGIPEKADFLVRAGANLDIQNNNGYTATMKAIWNMHNDSSESQSFDLILKGKPNLELEQLAPPPYLDQGVRTALDMAVHQALPEITLKLLKAGAQIEGPDRSALLAGARATTESLESVKVLIVAGAKINFSDKQGFTSLMYAALSSRDLQVLRFLISAGVDQNLRNNDGDTALILAARRPVLESVSILLEAGADPNIQGNGGETVMMLVRNLEIWQKLIKAGAWLDLQDENGETVLMKNVEGLQSVEFLIGAGANLNLRNNDGKTALGLANDSLVRQALLKAGGIE
jgi:ankyrin repeat protein